MPIGQNFGWGICGRYLTKELARISDVQLISEEFDPGGDEDREEMGSLKRLLVDLNGIDKGVAAFENPVLQAIQGDNLKPWFVDVKRPRPVGYTFFERDRLNLENTCRAKEYYEIIVAGSTWCEGILTEHGFTATETIIQGVDTGLFHPKADDKAEYRNKFVIFSGGKLELRKGQDLVIKAVSILQNKYPDVLLVNAWYNPWTPVIETMVISPYIRFEMPRGDYFRAVSHLLSLNGVDPARSVTVPPMAHGKMAEIYRDSDIGLFPNRCEGGTNLVLMEYMACGKPVIASYTSGHKDVLSPANSIPLKSLHPFAVRDQGGGLLYRWEEPELDEIVASLEWAYGHRDELKAIGHTAGRDLAQNTWEKAARRFHELLH
jgi:glycosyltransferase involved in cell wall biosynthesis